MQRIFLCRRRIASTQDDIARGIRRDHARRTPGFFFKDVKKSFSTCSCVMLSLPPFINSFLPCSPCCLWSFFFIIVFIFFFSFIFLRQTRSLLGLEPLQILIVAFVRCRRSVRTKPAPFDDSVRFVIPLRLVRLRSRSRNSARFLLYRIVARGYSQFSQTDLY